MVLQGTDKDSGDEALDPKPCLAQVSSSNKGFPDYTGVCFRLWFWRLVHIILYIDMCV